MIRTQIQKNQLEKASKHIISNSFENNYIELKTIRIHKSSITWLSKMNHKSNLQKKGRNMKKLWDGDSKKCKNNPKTSKY
jgi:hypothetical protein